MFFSFFFFLLLLFSPSPLFLHPVLFFFSLDYPLENTIKNHIYKYTKKTKKTKNKKQKTNCVSASGDWSTLRYHI